MKIIDNKVDYIGSGLAVVCGLHCMVLPLVLSTSWLSFLNFAGHPAFQWSFIGLGALVAIGALYHGYSHHKSIGIVIICLAGFVLLIGAEFVGSAWHLSFTLLGAVLVITAHFLNRRLQNR